MFSNKDSGFAMNLQGQTRNNTGRQTPPWCTALICFVMAAVFTAIGAGIIPLGESKLETARALEPEKEFEALGLTCEISSIDSVSQEEKICSRKERVRQGDGTNKEVCKEWRLECSDVFTFQYTYNETGVVEYEGIEEFVRRPQNPYGCSNNKPKGAPSRAVSDKIDCWRPRDGLTSSDIDSMYNCLNDPCFKMVDPALEVASAETRAKMLILVGKVLLGVAGLMVLGGAFSCCKR